MRRSNASASEPVARPAARRLALGLALLIGLAAGLALTEVTLRVLAASDRRAKHHAMGDAVLHHRLKPNFTRRVRGVDFTTNSLGMHDAEVSVRKPDGAFRILMLGDSFTEGGGLRLADTVPKRVESMLNGGGCRRPYEVLNAGVSSYSPILEYVYLERVGLGLSPDLVVLNFDMTDVHDDFVRTRLARLDSRGLPIAVPAEPIAETAILLPPLAKPRGLGFLDPVERLANQSAVYQAIRKSRIGQALFGSVKLTPERVEALRLAGQVQYDTLAITRDRESPSEREAWEFTRRYLLGIRQLARGRGIPFVLVVYPHAHQVSASESPEGRRRFGIGPGLFASDRPFRILEELGRREGVPVINLLPVFRARDAADGPLFWPDDIHHTPQGAKVFAEGLVAGLLERQALPRAAGRCRD